MSNEIKCKKCRKALLNQSEPKTLLLNAHYVPISAEPDMCESVQNNFFLNDEVLPHWIRLKIEAEEWSKGRLNCPHCESRIGGFDFVSGQKCFCSKYVLPPVHIIRSKIDLVTLIDSSNS